VPTAPQTRKERRETEVAGRGREGPLLPFHRERMRTARI